jgi:hypothetical protein
LVCGRLTTNFVWGYVMMRTMLLGLSCALAGCTLGHVAKPIPVDSSTSETCLLLETARCSYFAETQLPPDIAGSLMAGAPLPNDVCRGISTALHFDEAYLFVAARPTSVNQPRDAVLVARFDHKAIIAFRGTLPFGDGEDSLTALNDWLNDGDIILVKDSALHLEKEAVEKGFDDSLNNLWLASTTDKKTLFTVVKGWVDGGLVNEVDVTGHSKGGALATIGTLRLVQQQPLGIGGINPKLLRVTTFAAPRPGNAEFEKAYKQYQIPTVRYENMGDVIPHLPPTPDENSQFASLLFLAYVKPDSAISAVANQAPQQFFGMGKNLDPASPYVAIGDLQYIEPSPENGLPVLVAPAPSDGERISNFLVHIKGTSIDKWPGFIVDAHTIDPKPAQAGRGMDPYGYSGAICRQ